MSSVQLPHIREQLASYRRPKLLQALERQICCDNIEYDASCASVFFIVNPIVLFRISGNLWLELRPRCHELCGSESNYKIYGTDSRVRPDPPPINALSSSLMPD
ncbi:hypothetical protein J3459_015348 [Metarhizium acridum]|uniref:uncharacterized protein n=1 Tax=Metarhizium acridum TaxID=92637 RepID=UPI001C6BBC62|nr:hypothetical protein J3459_015348 [Metarhizium acridum]KAG8414005.1 hypothetical protein J3458_011659 [Metarhizium acridum]